MKLLIILFLATVYTSGVRPAAISPAFEGYSYEKPEQVFELEIPLIQSNPIETVAQKVDSNLEVDDGVKDAALNNKLPAENSIDTNPIVDENVAENIDLRYQATAEETAIFNEESQISSQGTSEIEAQSYDEGGLLAVQNKIQEQSAQKSVVESEVNQPESEIITVEVTEPQQYATVELASYDENLAVAVKDENEQQSHFENSENDSTIIQEVAQPIGVYDFQADLVAPKADEAFSTLEEIIEPQNTIEGTPDLTSNVFENRIYDENFSVGAVAEEKPSNETPQHVFEGYNYEKPTEQFDFESSFTHQDIASEHKSQSLLHQAFEGLSACGENARNWHQVVFDRSQERPNNRRLIPYTEVVVDPLYFQQ